MRARVCRLGARDDAMSMEYVSDERHQEIIESCVGHRLSKIVFSESGTMIFVFDNGVEIEISDGYCYSKLGDETGLGVILKDREIPVEHSLWEGDITGAAHLAAVLKL